MVEEKKEHENPSESSSKKFEMTEKLRSNPWMLSTFVCGALVMILLIATFSGNITGNVVSGSRAADNLMDYLNTVSDSPVSLVKVENSGSFYLATVNYQGQEIPVYLTKDGSSYTTTLVPFNSSTAVDQQQTTYAEVPKTDKPKIDLFVMSYCPYGTQAEKGILPVLNLLGDKVDFDLRFVYYAMHPSQGEVEENLRQYCIQKEQKPKFNDYLECFLEDGNSAACLTKTGVDKAKLDSCYSAADKQFSVSQNKADTANWLSGQFPLFDVDKALNEQYSVGGSPTLIINGQEANSGRSPAALLAIVCNAFTEGNVPEECSTTMPTQDYVPGFGWTLSSGTTTNGAQCY